QEHRAARARQGTRRAVAAGSDAPHRRNAHRDGCRNNQAGRRTGRWSKKVMNRWIDRILPSRMKTEGSSKTRSVPEGLWKKCPRCDAVLYKDNLRDNLEVCPKCDHHMRISARSRLGMFLDADSQVEIGADIEPVDILKFRDLKKYRDRLTAATKATGEKDAMVVMEGAVNGRPVVAAAFEFGFIGGSMGAVVGEKFVMGVNRCLEKNLPFVCFATSGGARMQEALVS